MTGDEKGTSTAQHSPAAQLPASVPFDFPHPSAASTDDGASRPPKSLFGRMRTLLKFVLFLVLTPVGCYLLAAWAGGLWTVNPDFESAGDGVEIFIVAGDIHADLILPVSTAEKDWRLNFPTSSFTTQTGDCTHVAIGWGSRKFFLETQTWDDVELSTVANVLFTPSDAVMHVEMIRNFEPVISSSLMRTRITAAQYKRLVTFVESSFAQTGRDGPDGNNSANHPQPTHIAGASYGTSDHFYPAVGKYHLFRTCNCWVGEAMQASGMKVGKFTPLPKQVFWHWEQ